MATIKKSDLVQFGSLELLAKQVVEGFITGLHKSPFHGFSVEFAEHRLYNTGESTKHIDWKLYGRTEKLFTKKYDEETNLHTGRAATKPVICAIAWATGQLSGCNRLQASGGVRTSVGYVGAQEVVVLCVQLDPPPAQL